MQNSKRFDFSRWERQLTRSLDPNKIFFGVCLMLSVQAVSIFIFGGRLAFLVNLLLLTFIIAFLFQLFMTRLSKKRPRYRSRQPKQSFLSILKNAE
jgi:dolichol kinase